MNPINAVAGAASLAGQVAYLPVATVQNLMHNYNEINESTLSGERPSSNLACSCCPWPAVHCCPPCLPCLGAVPFASGPS